MFFTVLNQYQRSIAAACILVLGIVQIALDAWTLHKIQQHEELILFLSGNSIPSNVMHDMTYEQALSYFSRLKQFLSPDLLEILATLQMTTVLGLVAGILQLFSSTAAVMWKGISVDIFWLVANFIVSILLAVAVSYISIHMIRDVPYHQVLLTVTVANLFILTHIWIVNLIALIHNTCLAEKSPTTGSSSSENLEGAEDVPVAVEPRRTASQSNENTRSVNNGNRSR